MMRGEEMASELIGLSQQEVTQRFGEGLDNKAGACGGRSYWDILKTNVFSSFNIILYVIGAALLAMGLTSDALSSVGIAIMNSLIGTIQEMGAKRKLEKISLLSRPQAVVRRDGRDQTIDPTQIVQGDLIKIISGDQVDVDGALVTSHTLEMDESLLTGESDLIRKNEGSELLSGSVCMTGEGYYRAEKVGAQSFANQVLAAAKSFELVKTPLQKGIDFIVRLLMFVVLIMSLIILASSFLDGLSASKIVQIAAVMTGQVPYGLFFLIVISYALGSSAIAQHGALVQQSNAVESLSNIDVLCTDKTGTLTSSNLLFEEMIPLMGIERQPSLEALGDFVRGASATNKTGEAIVAGTDGSQRALFDEVPFSSARKWSAVSFDTAERRGAFVLGAFEMLTPYLTEEGRAAEPEIMAAIDRESDKGLRVLLFAHNKQQLALHDERGEPQLSGLQPLGLVTLGDELRPKVRETIAAFTEIGIQLKVISGDNPRTVAALAKQAGLPDDIKLYSGLELAAADENTFRKMAQEGSIFGRITPDQKERLVSSLLDDGKYVAMIGDGVNDVLSLKKASLGIAMQSGSNATRNVADMVLLGDSFASLEPAFDKGKTIIGGVTNAVYLTLTRSLTGMFLIVAIAMTGFPFPFDPAQIALVSYTVGAPSLLFTLFARPQRLDPHMIRNLFRFALPIGVVTMLFGLVIYVGSSYMVQNQIVAVEPPERIIEVYSNYTGTDYGDEGFTEAFATIFAQTSLSFFIGITSMVVVYFLYPPFRFFAVWQEEIIHERRIAWTNLGLIILLIFVYTLPISEYVGLLPQPGPVMAALLVLVAVWTLCIRQTLKSGIFDRIFEID